MAKVKGPLFSVDAWGNFGGVLVYQRRRGEATVYPYTVPVNPNTLPQQGVRTSFAAATSDWNALPPASKAWWWYKAQGARLSGYNMYVQNYLLGLIAPPPPPPLLTYPESVLALGPVAYWRMGEVSGNLADESGNVNTAVANGEASYGVAGAIAGDSDKAVSLARHQLDYFEAANSSSLNTADVFSLVAWVKKASNGYHMTIISRGTNGYQLFFETTNYLRFMKAGVAYVVSSTITITDTGYHMVAVTKDGADVHLYIDGDDVSGTVTNATIVATGGVVQLGLDKVAGDQPWDGSLDEIAVFATALSAGDILALWELGSGA